MYIGYVRQRSKQILPNKQTYIINLIVSFNAIYAAATGAEYVIKNRF